MVTPAKEPHCCLRWSYYVHARPGLSFNATLLCTHKGPCCYLVWSYCVCIEPAYIATYVSSTVCGPRDRMCRVAADTNMK